MVSSGYWACCAQLRIARSSTAGDFRNGCDHRRYALFGTRFFASVAWNNRFVLHCIHLAKERREARTGFSCLNSKRLHLNLTELDNALIFDDTWSVLQGKRATGMLSVLNINRFYTV
jgi:hypothetical protein